MTSPPVKYVRQADYTGFEAAHPTDTKSGPSLDADFGALLISNNAIIDRLTQIQRSDGALANLCVTPDSFNAAALAFMAGTGVPRGAWLTTTAYIVKDLVAQNGLTYICVTAHASGVFATDLAAGKWLLFSSGITPFIADTVNGLVGINKTPGAGVVLDILAIASTNTPTIVQIANTNGGAAATSELRYSNGASVGNLKLLGSGYTPTGVFRADGLMLQANGLGGLTLCTGVNQPIYFAVNNVELGRFDAGFLLVGTTTNVGLGAGSVFSAAKTVSGCAISSVNSHGSPGSAQCHQFVFSASAPNDTTSIFFLCTDSGTTRHKVFSNGNVVNTNNSYGAISMRELKQDIVPARSQWNDVKALAALGVNYRLKSDVEADADTARTLLGAVAEDWEQISPGLVSVDGDGVKSVAYSLAYMKGLIALGEVMRRVETLEARP